jgi:radical SAM protein with 4Fe4S-binding SPASM domain
MDCPICFVHKDRNKYPPGDLSFDNFKKIIDEIGPTLLTLALWGYGEPLLNSNLPAMIQYAKQYDIFTAVSTNCYAMNEDTAHALVYAGLDYLIASIDGASEETFAKYRSPGKFRKAFDNLSHLCHKKRADNRKNPFVEWQFIVMKGNEHEIDKVKELAAAIGVDKLSFKKVWMRDKSNLKNFLPSDERYHLNIYKKGLDRSPCSRPWNTPLITWRGDMTVCCADFGLEHIMGNVFGKTRFREIWNNHKFRALRKQVIKNINSIGICRGCAAKNFTDGFLPLE